MRANSRYLKIKRNLHSLEERNYGSRIVSITSIDDPKKIFKVRYNSPEMKETIIRYRTRQKEFDVKLDELCTQKARLKKQLFR